MSSLVTADLQSALMKFGLSEFRRGQREVIDHILGGNDCLCVMPTGGGKSLCYQLPSVVRRGLTIVVSPLIALMKDQVDALVKRGIPATLINSSLSIAEQNYRLERVASGNYSLLYVAPERLRNPQFIEAIRSTPVQLLAVDEAHCISEWGHDFRPDYQRVGRFREALGGVQTVALTATATPRVRQDIVDSLKLRVAKHFITGFARDNLYFGVVNCHSDRDKDKRLLQFLDKKPGSGIIYAATRKRCESLVEMISKEARAKVGAYHAGLVPDQRKFIQEQFMRGELDTIVATNAFGMGIDKSDLRYVIHYNMPGTIEAYYQEAGRAGRDGLPSQCVLLYSPQDRYIQEFFIENANPSKDILQTVYEFLIEQEDDPIELTAEEIKERINAPVSSEAINSCLQLLGRTEVIERLEVAGGLAMVRITSQLATLTDLLPKEATVKCSVLRAVEKAVGDRRDEAVYINPRLLMQQLNMERETLSRHLRELCHLTGFEYVRPFRGRAIHVKRRDIPFEKLGIDYKTLDERKKSDYEKLDRMVAYSQTRNCRQKTILEYFGDGSASRCNICDRCQGKTGFVPIPKIKDKTAKAKKTKETPQLVPTTSQTIRAASGEDIKSRNSPTELADSRPGKNMANSDAAKPSSHVIAKPNNRKDEDAQLPSPVEQEQARQVASRVLGAIDRTHGYLSKTLLTQFFSGQNNRAIQSLRLTRLPEFALLKDWKKAHVSTLLDLLIEQNLLLLTELRAGKVTLSVGTSGTACLSGESSYPDSIISFIHRSNNSKTEPASHSKAQPANSAPDRNKHSTRESNIDRSRVTKESIDLHAAKHPPETSIQIAATALDSRQTSIPALNRDKEPSAVEPFVEPADFAQADLGQEPIRSLGELNQPQPDDAAVVRDPRMPTVEDWRWTVRLVQHGYRLGEVALIRGKQPDQILDDLTLAVSAKVHVPIDQLFDRRTQIAIRDLKTNSASFNDCSQIFAAFPRLWEFAKRWVENTTA